MQLLNCEFICVLVILRIGSVTKIAFHAGNGDCKDKSNAINNIFPLFQNKQHQKQNQKIQIKIKSLTDFSRRNKIINQSEDRE